MQKEYSNLKDKAYEIIKNKIITCELMPGTPVSENKLLAEIGSSRTPVREALSKLENENLVKIFPKRGIFVTDITVKDIIDIYTVRESIEPLAARLATPNISLEALEPFSRIYTGDSTLRNLEEYIKTDRQFHTLIANSTGNQYLAQILMGIYDQNSRIRILSKLKVKERHNEARNEHLELISHFINRDVQKAEDLMKTHVINGKKTALKIVAM